MKQSMGVGTVYLMGAELIFILSNYLIHIGVARYLGTEAYGLFGLLLSLYLINRAFLNTGVPRAVSKFVSHSPEKRDSIFQISFKLQLLLAFIFALLYIIFARNIAALLHDHSLTRYIVFLGVMVIPLALFSLQTSGYLNGLKLFREQALVKTIHAGARIVFTFLLVFLGWGIWGTLWGYLLAILAGLLISWRFLKKKSATLVESSYSKSFPVDSLISWEKILAFALPITAASLAFTLIRNVDVLFIKYFLADNTLVAFYTAAFTLSTAPAMIFTTLPQVLMPSVSQAVARNNLPLVQKYISQSFRYTLLLLLPLTALVAVTSTKLLNLFYSSTYSVAGPVLSVLIVGSMFWSLFALLTSVTTGSGKPWIEMVLGILFLIMIVILDLLLIPQQGIIGAAYSFVITSFLALSLVSIYIYARYKTLLPWFSLARITLGSVLVSLLAYFFPYQGLALVPLYAGLFLLYFLLLYLFGELEEEDFLVFKKMAGSVTKK